MDLLEDIFRAVYGAAKVFSNNSLVGVGAFWSKAVVRRVGDTFNDEIEREGNVE